MKKALDNYKAARAAHIAARNTAEEKRYNCFTMTSSERIKNPEAAKTTHEEYTAACQAEERAQRIKAAAAEIAERKIKAAAAPIVEATLKKYAGKAAGPKTREKAAAEIAAALGARSAYFTGSYYGSSINRVVIYMDWIDNEISPEIYAERWEKMVDENNRFVAVNIPIPSVDGLPDDLEAWADEFDRAAEELERAKKSI